MEADGFLRRADGSIYGRVHVEDAYKLAADNLRSLGLPADGTGCYSIDLGTDVYGLVDYDGEYRVGIYWNLPEDDGGVCARFDDWGSCKSFVHRLQSAHAPEASVAPPRPDMVTSADRQAWIDNG